MLSAWHDSLEHVTSITILNRYPERGNASSEAASLRRLMYRLRSAQLRRSNGDIERALGGLLLEAGQHPAWPWPPYLLARSYEWMHSTRLMSGGWSGVLPSEMLAAAAWRNISVMMTIDPTFDVGRNYFFEKLLAVGERELHEYQAGPLAIELNRPAPDARALLVAARQNRAIGNSDSAIRLLIRAGRAGGDPSLLALERARAASALGDTAAASRAYWEGLRQVTPAGRIAYHYDLEWLVPPDSLRGYDRASNDSLIAWVRRFWSVRDASVANKPGERLQHHLQRWAVVLATFRVTTPWRKTELGPPQAPTDNDPACYTDDLLTRARLSHSQPSYPGDLRDRESLLDHRGVVYLRRGPPLRFRNSQRQGEAAEADVLPQTNGSGIRNSSLWYYWFDGSYQQLTFGGSAAFGTQAPTTLLTVRRMDSLRAALPLPNPVAGSIAPPLVSGSGVAPAPRMPNLATVPIRCPGGREVMASHPLALDADFPPFVDEWPTVFRAYALGHGSDATALLSFAVAGNRIGAGETGSGTEYWPLRVRVVGYQAQTGLRIEYDTLLRLRDPANERTRGYLTGWIEVPITSGQWQVAVRISQGSDSAGSVSLQRGLVVPPAGTPNVSDLIRGIDGARLWIAGDQRGFPLNPLASWRQETPLDVYYEVYGLGAGQSYQANLQVREGTSTGRKVLELHANETATGSSSSVRKVLTLDALPVGGYTLIVTISSGKFSAERQLDFYVTAR